MYIFFDTETNGLPVHDNDGKMVWPRMIQLAFIVTDADFNIKTKYCQLIKPDGWHIPNQKFWIDNGYSTDKNMAYGVDIKAAIKELVSMINYCNVCFAHNMAFDFGVLSAEMNRIGLRANKKIEKICTMKDSTKFVGALNRNGVIKWPRLDELHIKLFGCGFDGAHDALCDVEATIRCTKELVKLGIIKL